jgi:hypothetical protein
MDLDLEKIIAHQHLPRLDPFGGRAEEGSRAHAAAGTTKVTLMRAGEPLRNE